MPRTTTFFRLIIVLLSTSLFSRVLLAQYRFTQWTSETGLPQSSVRGLVQAPDGYVWIATLNGLARFDGVRFQIYDKSNTPGMSSNRIVAMVPGADGDLWMTGEDLSLVRMHHGGFATITNSQGVGAHSVNAITGDQGRVWILSGTKVLLWDESTQQFHRADFSTEDLMFRGLRWMATGFWAQKGNELLCFNRGTMLKFAIPGKIDTSQINGVAVNAMGEGWIATSDGKMMRLGDRAGTLSTDASGFMLYEYKIDVLPGRLERRMHLPVGGHDRTISANVVLPDSEGDLWLGTEGEGLYHIQRQQIRTLTEEQGLASNNTFPVMHSKSGAVWAGSWPGGLSEIRDGKVVRRFGKEQGLSGLVSSLFEDRDGVLWIGTHDGVFTLNDGRLRPTSAIAAGDTVAQAIEQGPDGSMLFGTGQGLTIVKDGISRTLTMRDGLATDDVRVIVRDRRGDQWIGGYGGLTRIHDGQFTRWTEKEGLPSNNIRSIHEDWSGAIWVGTYDGGIGWYRAGQWITFNRKRGLFDNGAFQILEDTKRHFWVSSNRGIYRVDRDQLEAVADGREALVTSVGYGRADGMLSAECNGGSWPAGAQDSAGLLWFPTQMGIAIIDPGRLKVASQPPRVLIENFSVDLKEQTGVSIALKPGQSSLEINYTAPSFNKPEQLAFRYKLDGVDDDWQRVGSRRTAYYTHLPPGDYVFRVSARNGDGVRSLKDAELSVTVIPPFYRRWWFIFLVCCLIALLVTGIWKRRIRQLKDAQIRQQNFSRQLIASQEGERRRISAELHDSLGQRLIIINNLALIFLKTKGRPRSDEEKRQTVVEISEEATAAIEETRAISYALRPFQLDRLGLTRAIQALCTSVQRGAEIGVSTDLDNIDEVFSEDLRINVYRIIQEGLNNVVKHSGASRAIVTARRNDGIVTLTIQDNGHGMSAKSSIPEPGKGGFGMAGMRERATLLRGELEIKSSPDSGTLLTIDLPI
jgi:signal transduction histidine kinase/ligand-binding sensor domain-containing protein